MIIAGLQKLTLIDYPDKVACSLFLYGCNFRCGFCHNPSLVVGLSPDRISEEDVLKFLAERKKYLEGVCITGGEPLMSVEEDFLRKIKALGYSIKIDTNGSYPEKLKELISKGLVDFAAMDIKSSNENYAKVTASKADTAKIEESIRIVAGLPKYEFRTTVVGKFHNLDEMRRIAEWLNRVVGEKPERYCLQGFRNSGEFVDNAFKAEQEVERGELEKMAKELSGYFGQICIRA